MQNLTKDPSYQELLLSLKRKIGEAQIRAFSSVNRELLLLYWEIGQELLKRQEKGKWGTKVLAQLSGDLQKAFPSVKGFSNTNLKYMRQFAKAYPEFSIGQAPLDQISWYHNITLLSKCETEAERIWYANKTLQNGWSRNVMVHHIESKLFERSGKALNNFQQTLPKPQSDLAESNLKDPYLFDFLMLSERAGEKELENALVGHLKDFLMELGVGFAYLGQQYPLQIGEETYYLDLLFYHARLHCYVAVELKIGKFKAEYVGKMNLYLSGLDELIKTDEDQPSIGIIICKSKENVVAEYALRDVSKPIGISEYKLAEALPENLQAGLPSVEEIEKELKN